MKKLQMAAMTVLLLVAGRPAARGGTIALEMEPAVALHDGAWTVSLKIVNRGTEAAQDVWTEAAVGDVRGRSAVRDTLNPYRAVRQRVSLPPLRLSPGRHTVVLRVHYTDAGGYPFSALETVPILTADSGPRRTGLVAALHGDRFYRRGRLRLRVAPTFDSARQVTVRLVLPDAFDCRTPVRQLTLHPGRAREETFTVLNRSAPVGSSYAVMAILDYEDNDGLHETGVVDARFEVAPFCAVPAFVRTAGIGLTLILAVLFLIVQGLPRAACLDTPAWRRAAAGLLLTAITVFILWHFPIPDLFRRTITVGGDTPAHHYLAAHLRQQLIAHGSIISWAPGWWCGFPMFQYYFCLPYLATALLGLIIPLEIALKLVTVFAVLAIPWAAWLAARGFRCPYPTPALTALATVPLLFDAGHTMWGVNLYSTLAGMIANSLSFAIMLVFLGAAARDAESGRFRVTTVLLFALLLASHFFTSIMAVLTTALLPLSAGRGKRRHAFFVLATEGLLGGLLMAWWLAPLIAKRGFSVDFGLNWEVTFWKQLPAAARVALFLLPPALFAGGRLRRRWVWMLTGMLLLAGLLFRFGFSLSPVFVNVRLWPFVVFSLLALGAAGLGRLLSHSRATPLALAALLGAVLCLAGRQSSELRSWASWNYAGMQAKSNWPVFEQLVLPLDGTPGRLANDLHDANRSLGSSRIFEVTPYLIDKPILEGGIVNSAIGSLFAYYIQSETSRACAGFPPIVMPATFDMSRATKHLELFNVKHFIARWQGTRDAMAASDDWAFLREARGWALYELTTHDGGYVYIPEHAPAGVRVEDWKRAALAWLYTPRLLDRPYAFLRPDAETAFPGRVLSADAYAAELAHARDGAGPLPRAHGPVTQVSAGTVTPRRIRFRTEAPGRAHIVKCSYFPNWKLRGGGAVYPVTPGFMLVYPTTHEVELYYGATLSDTVGRGLTGLGAIVLIGSALLVRKRNHGTSHHMF